MAARACRDLLFRVDFLCDFFYEYPQYDGESDQHEPEICDYRRHRFIHRIDRARKGRDHRNKGFLSSGAEPEPLQCGFTGLFCRSARHYRISYPAYERGDPAGNLHQPSGGAGFRQVAVYRSMFTSAVPGAGFHAVRPGCFMETLLRTSAAHYYFHDDRYFRYARDLDRNCRAGWFSHEGR